MQPDRSVPTITRVCHMNNQSNRPRPRPNIKGSSSDYDAQLQARFELLGLPRGMSTVEWAEHRAEVRWAGAQRRVRRVRQDDYLMRKTDERKARREEL